MAVARASAEVECGAGGVRGGSAAGCLKKIPYLLTLRPRPARPDKTVNVCVERVWPEERTLVVGGADCALDRSRGNKYNINAKT